MKELYLNPEMDVVKFSVDDIITTSGVGGDAGDEMPTTPGCDEVIACNFG